MSKSKIRQALWFGCNGLSLRRHLPIAFLIGALPGNVSAQQEEAKPGADPNGSVHLNLDIPLSVYMSGAARHLLSQQLFSPSEPPAGEDIAALRRSVDQMMLPLLERVRKTYAAHVETANYGGVGVDVVTPDGGVPARNRKRVLINLHGGSFSVGEGATGLIESIPIAVVGGFKVVSVHYRMGPEHAFPAASQDVESVFRELLKQYKPENIGIYGCSSGGNLTAMAMAWFQKQRLPRPGAIGILCATADILWSGDSSYLAPFLGGGQSDFPPRPRNLISPYLKKVDSRDPLVSPVFFPEILSRFPPTLFITGTRSMELSGAVYAHTQLIKAGNIAELHVWEGMWHGFIYNVELPEARESFDVITGFFDRYLGKKNKVGQ